MAEHSAIEWTDATWNPTTGCTKTSPACANCYIERTPPFRVAGRKFVNGHIPLQLHHERLGRPQEWKKPLRIFVNSQSDLFHPDVPDHFVAEVWRTMYTIRRHTYQVLTKRHDRMAELVPRLVETFGVLANVWLGVSVENQHFADRRIPLLLQTPAAVRFISCEPLLGPVNLSQWLAPGWCCNHPGEFCEDIGCHGGACIDWVIAGFESGPRRRPPNESWARSLRDQSVAAGIPFMFKQWGGLTSKSGGRILDGRTWDEFPEAIA